MTDHRTIPNRRTAVLLMMIAVGAVVAAVHWRSLSAQALSYDDKVYVKGWLIQHPSWETAWRFISEVLHPTSSHGYYHPLAMLSLMLDAAAGGNAENLIPFHRTSLALHVLSAMLVFLLTYRLFGGLVAAAAAALLFGVHPTTVESVAWVGARKGLLAGTFVIACLALYVEYVRRRSAWAYAAALAAFFLALLSKPTSLPLPVLLLLLDAWPLRRLDRAALREKWPFFALCGLMTIVSVISHASTARLALPADRDWSETLLLACGKIAFALQRIVWPAGSSTYYDTPSPLTLGNPTLLKALLLVSAAIIIVVLARRRRPGAWFASLFFFASIGPMLGLFQYGGRWIFLFDNYLYIPMLGFVILLAGEFAAALKRTPPASFAVPLKYALVACILLITIGLARESRRYLAYWRDTLTLHERAVALRPHARGYNLLGSALFELGRYREARARFQQALELEPDFAEAHNNLGALLIREGRFDEAVASCRTAIQLKPTDPEAHNNLAMALVELGRLDDAVAECRTALQIDPDSAEALGNLGRALERLGKVDDAIACYRRALSREPKSPQLLNNLAGAWIRAGRFDEAVEASRQSISLDAHFGGAHHNLATALLQSGRLEEALASAKTAVRLRPDLVIARYNLALTLMRLGHRDEAIHEFRDALKLAPRDPEMHFLLAENLAATGRTDEAVTEYAEVLRLDPASVLARQRLQALQGRSTPPPAGG